MLTQKNQFSATEREQQAIIIREFTTSIMAKVAIFGVTADDLRRVMAVNQYTGHEGAFIDALIAFTDAENADDQTNQGLLEMVRGFGVFRVEFTKRNKKAIMAELERMADDLGDQQGGKP